MGLRIVLGSSAVLSATGVDGETASMTMTWGDVRLI
jgi:hypothetical protein